MTNKEQTKHTPGPWAVHQTGYRFSIEHDTGKTILPEAGTISACIAILGSLHEFEALEYPNKVERLVSQKEANAHLIAAAPDTLDACRFSLAALEEYFIPTGKAQEYREATNIVLDKLRNAIAKAEGRADHASIDQ